MERGVWARGPSPGEEAEEQKDFGQQQGKPQSLVSQDRQIELGQEDGTMRGGGGGGDGGGGTH